MYLLKNYTEAEDLRMDKHKRDFDRYEPKYRHYFQLKNYNANATAE